MPSNILQVAYANFTVLLGSGGARSLAFLVAILLARALGAEGFGQFSLFQAALVITSQVPEAFDTAFVRYAKEGKDEDDKANISRCLASATRLKIYFVLLMLLCAWPAALVLQQFKPDEPHLGKLLACGIICGAFICFMNSVANLLRVKEQFGRFSLVQALYNSSLLLVLGSLFLLGGVLSIRLTITIYLVIAFIFGAFSLWFVAEAAGNPFKAPAHLNKKLFALSKWVLPTVICFYVFSRIDILMLSAYLPFAEVGVYSAAGQIILIISVMIGAGSTVFMPRSIKAVQSGAALRGYFKETLIPMAMTAAGIFLLYAAAPWIFKIVFGAGYSGSTGILRILLPGYAFVALYSPLSFLFYALDRPELRFYLEGIKLLSAIALLYIAIPKFGLYGAAWAMSLCMILNSLISTVILVLFLQKKLRAQ